MKKLKIGNNSGFTLIQVLAIMALTAVFIGMVLNFSSVMGHNTQRLRSVGTQTRVLAGIREIARLPATLRASMRASQNGVAVNPKLLACAGGGTLNGCPNDQEIPLTLYYPIYPRNAAGAIIGLQPISAPLGSTTPMRMDSYGVPCTTASPECSLLVYTSFKAQCGPPQVSTLPSTITADKLIPSSSCTVAEAIAVTYYVVLDPNIAPSDPSLASFINQTTGTVSVSVIAISGNQPQ